MPRLEGLGYRLEDNMHLLNLDAQGQPVAPPKPGAPAAPPVMPPLPGQKASSSVNDPEKARKAGKPSKKPLNTAQCTSIAMVRFCHRDSCTAYTAAITSSVC